MKNPENSPNPAGSDEAKPTGGPQAAQPKARASRRKRPTSKPGATAKSSGLNIPRSTKRLAARLRQRARVWSKRISGSIHAWLARLDTKQLKWVLVACGIAATMALVIIAMAKLSPLIIVLLAVLGLSAVLQLWGRLVTLRVTA